MNSRRREQVFRGFSEWLDGRGVKLRDGSGGGWEVKQVLYADDPVLVPETREHFLHIVNERLCDCMGSKLMLGRIKCLQLKRTRGGVVRR